ncbi:selenoprotein L isoform 1-T1 [Synchiropus picturatus]
MDATRCPHGLLLTVPGPDPGPCCHCLIWSDGNSRAGNGSSSGERLHATSLETFVAQKISALLGLIAAGADFYRSVGVTRKSEAEGVWQRFYGRDAVAEQVEALLQLERDWDGFLDWVDKSLQTGRSTEGVPAARVGPELVLTDGRSGGSVTLAQHLQAGHKLLLVLIRHYG